MALALNLTVLVQVINFFIAYALITQLFLKPGYRAFKAEEDRMKQLKEALIHDQNELAYRELYKTERWQRCQSYFASHRPHIAYEMGGLISSKAVEPLKEISAQEYDASVKEISQRLKKELMHD
jgi:hypothetical protein